MGAMPGRNTCIPAAIALSAFAPGHHPAERKEEEKKRKKKEKKNREQTRNDLAFVSWAYRT